MGDEEAVFIVAMGGDAPALARELGLSPLASRVVARAVRARLDAMPSLALIPAPMPTVEEMAAAREVGTVVETERCCTGCGRWLRAADFHRGSRVLADGRRVPRLRSRCRECEAEARRRREGARA